MNLKVCLSLKCFVVLNVLSAEKPAQPLAEEKKGSKGKKSTEQISKYRDLLKSIQDKEKEKEDNMDMEITWVPGIRASCADPLFLV